MARPAADLDSLILELWRNLQRGRVFASRAVAELFAHQPRLSGQQRDRIVGTLYGMLSHQRRIEHALCPDGRQPRKLSALAQLLAYRVLEGQLSVAQAQRRLPSIDWPAVVAANAAIAAEPDMVKRLGLAASLPDFLTQRLLAQYGDEAEVLAGALSSRAPLTVRVNTLRASRPEVIETLTRAKLRARPTLHASSGIEIETRTDVFSLPEFAAGVIEMQDEASQLVAELVAPPPGGLVIDYCAGAGGKTLALGALMHNRGRLIALDVHGRRLDELRRRARRAGLSNARAVLLSAEGGWPEELKSFLGKADRVLVDAPCSGVGAFRRKPDLRLRLVPEALARLPREQETIARQAMQLCAPGGRLIYATCTLLAEENERVVENLLRDSDFRLVPVKEILGKATAAWIADSSGTFLKLFPHRHNTDGFFAAVLRRKKA